jgi:hypothetical protein
MKGMFAVMMILLALQSGTGAAQTPSTSPSTETSESLPQASDGWKDLDAATLSCARAALNAAAREATKVQARGTYHFSYFDVINESHHARYEVRFHSNYHGEPDLKYCVVLYCQQGWDPAQAQAEVTLLGSKTKTGAVGSCAEVNHVTGPAQGHTAPRSQHN